VITRYRADVERRTEIPGARSWTSSYANAYQHASGAIVGSDRPQIYQTDVAAGARIADLRPDAEVGFQRLGIEVGRNPVHTDA
jgi:hypothetical protein